MDDSGAVDTNLAVIAKVSSLIEFLRLRTPVSALGTVHFICWVVERGCDMVLLDAVLVVVFTCSVICPYHYM